MSTRRERISRIAVVADVPPMRAVPRSRMLQRASAPRFMRGSMQEYQGNCASVAAGDGSRWRRCADLPMRARLRLVNRCDRVTIGFAGARSLLRAAAGCARVPGLDGVEAGPSEKAIVSLLTRCAGC